MPAAYAAADLVVARSGAMTIAEIAAAGRPALLVPFAAATHGHQEANARALEAGGAAVVLTEAEATDEPPRGGARGPSGRSAASPRDGRGGAPLGASGRGRAPLRSAVRGGGGMNFLRVKRLHFVGIGGIGMSGLAELLKSVGLDVTGSDLALSETTLRLRASGIPVFTRATAPSTSPAPTSSSIRPPSNESNPEVAAARAAGPSRHQAGRDARRGHARQARHRDRGRARQDDDDVHDRRDPRWRPASTPRSSWAAGCARWGTPGSGTGEYLVAEADEFDRSFLVLSPMLAVVNNIDLEHLDTYRDLADLKETFARFARSVPFFGAAILGLDDPNVQEIRPLVPRRVVTFGLTPQADVTVRDLVARSGRARASSRPRAATSGGRRSPGAGPPQREERARGARRRARAGDPVPRSPPARSKTSRA